MLDGDPSWGWRRAAGQGWEVLGHRESMAGRQRNGNEEVPVEEEETNRMGLGRGWDWKCGGAEREVERTGAGV